MRSATRGRDAAAMIERRADEIVACFWGTERGMGREGDVFQRRQDVAGRQGALAGCGKTNVSQSIT